VSELPPPARRVLERGTLCYLAARTPPGLHVTPVVFILEGDRLWATTARRTVKARAWREDPVTAGMVRAGGRVLAFRGRVRLHDALDPTTWMGSVRRGPQLARASARFTLKNARFFAGYARDARRVPLSWTPPARIVVSVDLEAGVLLLEEEGGMVSDRWGAWGETARSRSAYREVRAGGPPMRRVPTDVRRRIGSAGDGVVAVEGSSGPVVLPARWVRTEEAAHAVLPRSVLALADPEPEGPGALVADQASAWRASRMAGLLLRGAMGVYVPSDLRSGADALRARVRRAGRLPQDPAVLRIRPRVAVWWRGWSSGTVSGP
jgi:hypothetical protein